MPPGRWVIWKSDGDGLDLIVQVDLTADSFAELVENARDYLDEAYPNEAVPMRVLLCPMSWWRRSGPIRLPR